MKTKLKKLESILDKFLNFIKKTFMFTGGTIVFLIHIFYIILGLLFFLLLIVALIAVIFFIGSVLIN